jgi:hypothetical protein
MKIKFYSYPSYQVRYGWNKQSNDFQNEKDCNIISNKKYNIISNEYYCSNEINYNLINNRIDYNIISDIINNE